MNLSASLKSKAHKIALGSLVAAAMSQMAIAAEPSHLEHPHSAGTFMFEAMYMRMNMEGLRAGTSDVSTAEATAMNGAYDYSQVPTEMTMDMYMLMPMYNFTKDLSVMLMFNYLSNDMKMEGTCDTTMSTSGWGDTQASVGYKFADDQFAFSMDLNIPTGSINEKTKMDMRMGDMCMEHTMMAPYPMQLGSGTYDVMPSFTYLGAYYSWRYGAQASYKFRTGENDNGYKLGNEAKAKLWVRKPVYGVVLSGEFDVKRWGGISGQDDSMNTTMSMTMSGVNGGAPFDRKTSPANFTSNSGGTLAELNLGASVPVMMTAIGGKLTIPVYQDFNGIQMKRALSWELSVSAMF